MKKWKTAFASAFLLVPTASQAAIVLRSYTVDFSFAAGPITSLRQTFTVSYDPTIVLGFGPATPTQFGYEVGDYSASSNLPTFSGTIFAGMSDTNGVSLYFSKPPVFGVQTNADDFSTRISVDNNGDITSPIGDILYSTVGAGRFYQSRGTVVQNPVTGSVPEIATWAMMITGFGMVGAVLRRRRHEAWRASMAQSRNRMIVHTG